MKNAYCNSVLLRKEEESVGDIHPHMYVYIYRCTYMCVCVCIYIYFFFFKKLSNLPKSLLLLICLARGFPRDFDTLLVLV